MDGKIGMLKECPDCAGTNVVYVDSRDQLVCRDCGLVFEPLAPEIEEEIEKTHNLNLGLAKVSKSKKPVSKKKVVKKKKR